MKLSHNRQTLAFLDNWLDSKLESQCLRTLVTVAKVGLPLGDNALYSSSLANPESFANRLLQ